MKILVVDDEKLVVKGIKFNLEHDGYEVVTAFDGESAVALTSSEKPDLVILDLMMPKLDGLEACMQIRTFSNVPIIMLTARSTERRSAGEPAAAVREHRPGLGLSQRPAGRSAGDADGQGV